MEHKVRLVNELNDLRRRICTPEATAAQRRRVAEALHCQCEAIQAFTHEAAAATDVADLCRRAIDAIAEIMRFDIGVVHLEGNGLESKGPTAIALSSGAGSPGSTVLFKSPALVEPPPRSPPGRNFWRNAGL